MCFPPGERSTCSSAIKVHLGYSPAASAASFRHQYSSVGCRKSCQYVDGIHTARINTVPMKEGAAFYESHPASPINLLLYTHLIFKEQKTTFISAMNSSRTCFLHRLFQMSERSRGDTHWFVESMSYVLKPLVVFILFYILKVELGKSGG